MPIVGVSCFVILYYFSSTLYPGGSQANSNTIGFDWVNNYWCNLMNENAINGAINNARPFSVTALIILCGSLAVFFYQFGKFSIQSYKWKKTIKTCGVLSMFFATLIFTDYHDVMIMISSLFGLFLTIGILKEIYENKRPFYKWTGIICLLLLLLNNVIYYLEVFIEWLPLIQKITFLIVLIWILGLNYELRRKILAG